VRRTCFEQIGGFVAARGWDTVDEIKAITLGWQTRHFADLKMQHWKPEGTGIGWWRTRIMHGEVYYLTGGSKLFFLLKVLYSIKSPPVILGGVGMLWGYVYSAIIRKPRLVSPAELKRYRSLLNGRLADKLRGLLRLKQNLA
jgi:biofilm PGA synthesis N-glycosyltransferase PgaC